MSEFRLPRLEQNASLTDKLGRATVTFQRWWQSVVSKIETQESTQDNILAELAATQAELAQAQADIITALDQAGIALDLAGAIMPDIPPITIVADYTGVVLGGQLPRNVAATRFDGDTDVTASAAWSATTLSGGATYTIGASTGVLNITALAATTVVEIASLYEGVTRSRKLLITKALQDPPPSSGTGEESSYDSTINSTTSDTYGTENAGPLTLVCGASGEVQLAAPLSMVSGSTTSGNYHAFGKWQYRPSGGGAWTDVGPEIQSDVPATVLAGNSEQEGSISVNQTQAGLTPTTEYEFQLLLRNSFGTEPLSYSGTASATTS